MSNKNTFSHNHLTSEQIELLLQDLIQKQTKLNKIHADLLDSMEKHGIDKKRFTEYFTIEPDEMTNYTFEQNIAAVFVKDVLVKEEFCPKIQDVINNIVATRSPEGLKTFVLSTEQLSKLSQDSGMSVSDAKELFLKYVDDIKSPFWDTCREEMKKIQTEFPYIRGDFDRGVLEYCQDGDMDYIFSVDRSIAEDEPKIYTALVEDYSNMKKTESTDEILELILKLLPVLYTNAPSLFSLHRNPEKAKKIYDDALAARPATKPAIPKKTKDLLGRNIYVDIKSESSSVSKKSSDSAKSSNDDSNCSIIGRCLIFCVLLYIGCYLLIYGNILGIIVSLLCFAFAYDSASKVFHAIKEKINKKKKRKSK